MRRLAPEEAALWKKVITTVKPMVKAPAPAPAPVHDKQVAGSEAAEKARSVPPLPVSAKPVKESLKRADARTHPQPLPFRAGSGEDATLDGTWDRRLSRGVVAPESSIDLHGHSLASAYSRLDRGLEQAIARGDRVLLLVTGKPPVAESERPHSRGAIRAAVGDWLASSRFADRIAAVRGAHPRHGGNGALYIVLRRPRTAPLRKS